MPPARFIIRYRKKIIRTIDFGYKKVVDDEDQTGQFLKEDIKKLAYHTIHNS